MLVEDAHVNIIGILQYFDKFMVASDYLIVDDTNPIAPSVLDDAVFDVNFDEFGSAKLEEMTSFLESKSQSYKVDCFYTDFFG